MEASFAMQHPGSIVYVDGNTSQVIATKKPSEVPEDLRFAPGPDGTKIPIVRVVATVAGDQRTIREYGPEGQVLRSTIQRKR
jgi:hypothetical protein